MKAPKITVVIPAYNSEKYIGRCLKSVLGQSFEDFEVLVIDDGSTDRTGEVVREYAVRDERIIYKKQKNIGVAKTRNEAIKMARGEFLAFIDNDDFIDEDYLERLLPRAGEDAVLSGYRRPNSEGKVVKEVRLEDAEWSKFVVPTPWAKICRKEFLVDNELWFLDNNIGEDVYFNLLMVLATDKIRITDYVGYNWYVNEMSVSNTKQRNFDNLDVFGLLNSCYDELERRGLLEKNYEVLELFFFRYVVWFLLFSSKGQSGEAAGKKYDELFGWLKERFPNYRENRSLRGRLPGEVKSTRAAYKTFWRFQKMGLGKSLVRMWAKI